MTLTMIKSLKEDLLIESHYHFIRFNEISILPETLDTLSTQNTLLLTT